MDAIKEYKETEHYKNFTNYQKYYEDAKQQNEALSTLEKKEDKKAPHTA
jgi:hypothetical protein